MKATEKQVAYLTKLAQRVIKAAGTPGVEGSTISAAEYCMEHCSSFSKEKASLLIDDFRFLVRSVNFMRNICNKKQV